MPVMQEQPQNHTTSPEIRSSIPKGVGDTSRAVEALWHRSYATFTGMSASLRSYKPPYIVGHIMPEQLASTRVKINALLNWEDGWNGYDAGAPSLPAIRHAHVWIEQLYRGASAWNRRWIDPNVTADAGGEVVFGWWNGERELSVYVSGDNVEYVKAWGVDPESEMSEGASNTPEAALALWQWLTQI